METFDGISLTVGGAAVGTIVTALVNIWRARNQKTEISPVPLAVEQSAYQARMKDNERDHENLFGRVGRLEQDVSGLKSDAAANGKILDRMASQVEKLYDLIIKGRK